MKRIAAMVLVICLWTTTLMAETLTPQETVRALITRAQTNELKGVLDTAALVKIAAQPRHSRAPRDLIAFMRRTR